MRINVASKIILVWFFILLAVGFASTFFIGNSMEAVDSFSTPLFSRFDSNWYVSISEHGYFFTPGERSNAVFFPLYPLVIRIFHFFTRIPNDWSGFIISIIFAFIAIRLFFSLLKLDYSREKSISVILVWILFPSSFFLISVYPTSLFVALAIASFYFARKENWKLAGFFAAFSALTRPYGIFLMFSIGLEYLLANNFDFKKAVRKLDWLYLTLPALALLSLSLYMKLKFGKPFLSYENQVYWGKEFIWPYKVLLGYLSEVTSKDIFSRDKFYYLVNLGAIVFFVFSFALSIIHKVRWPYLVLPLLTFLTIIAGGNFIGSHRYLFEMFPLFVGPTIALAGRKTVFYAYLIVSFLLLVLFTSLFVSWFPLN